MAHSLCMACQSYYILTIFFYERLMIPCRAGYRLYGVHVGMHYT